MHLGTNAGTLSEFGETTLPKESSDILADLIDPALAAVAIPAVGLDADGVLGDIQLQIRLPYVCGDMGDDGNVSLHELRTKLPSNVAVVFLPLG